MTLTAGGDSTTFNSLPVLRSAIRNCVFARLNGVATASGRNGPDKPSLKTCCGPSESLVGFAHGPLLDWKLAVCDTSRASTARISTTASKKVERNGQERNGSCRRLLSPDRSAQGNVGGFGAIL
jgi:hypothetical protein